MASEGLLVGRFSPDTLAPALFGFALLLGLLSFPVGWYSVDTRAQVWLYDANDPEGKGTYVPEANGRVHMEMRMFSLSTEIAPRQVQDFVESAGGLPTYDEQAPRTGTAMRGIFLLDAVAILGLAAAGGFYLVQRRTGRNLGAAVWKLAAVFGAFALTTVAYLYLVVPESAERDTHEILQEYSFYFERAGLPNVPPTFFQPNLKFWNTWICCSPPAPFTRDGQEYLVVVTTESRPSAGFWLVASDLLLVTAGLALAGRAGHFDPKRPPRPAGDETSDPPSLTKAA